MSHSEGHGRIQPAKHESCSYGKYRSGINGFGRIGRLVTRILIQRSQCPVAINDPCLSIQEAAYLFEYDSVHGKFHGTVEFSVGDEKSPASLTINGCKLFYYSHREVTNIPWNDHMIDTVFECSGVHKSLVKVSEHLHDFGTLEGNDKRKVILSAPPKDTPGIIPMIVMGVNHKQYSPKNNVISMASCTSNCLAPLASILHNEFGIEEGIFTTVHSVTASQNVVDGSGGEKDLRGGRNCFNIIPSSTGAATAVTEAIPSLRGKLTGMAFRVPVSDVSCIDFTVKLSHGTSLEEITSIIKKASTSSDYHGIISIAHDNAVSSDFISNSMSCIFDPKCCIQLSPTFFKLIAWYDNEYGYSSRMVDLSDYINCVQAACTHPSNQPCNRPNIIA